MVSLLAAIFLLGICIFFHELGHFLLGKLLGIRPKVFSIGYGRPLFSKKIKGTRYQITAIPLGGYVQFSGDDPTKEYIRLKPGDFFAEPAWKRILVALGGPLFSILLGFFVLFGVFAFGFQPPTNQIRIDSPQSLAAKVGLKSGDRIIAINGEKTPSFDKVSYAIAFSNSNQFTLTIEREGKVFDLPVYIPRREEGGIRVLSGIRPEGKNYVFLTADRQFSNGVILRKGDKILQVEDVAISSVEQLIEVLNQVSKSEVKLTVLRKKESLFAPENEIPYTWQVPVQEIEALYLRQVKDIQTGKLVKDKEILAREKEIIARIQFGGEFFSNWEDLKKALWPFKDKKAILRLGAVEVEAEIGFGFRKILGITLAEGIDAEKAVLPRDFWALIQRSYEELLLVIRGTLAGLWQILQGKLSFNKSVSGPVKIVAVAAKSVSQGWETYWFLLAQITIILGIMNLLPIPVLDGGHILFYFIEAVYRPLSPKVIALSYRLGFAFLLAVGVYVIALDIYDVFIRGLF